MMHPIDDATPKDRELLLWSPFRGGTIAHGKWNDDNYVRRPRPYWKIYWIETVWGKGVMRDNQPTHWCEVPTSPDQVTVSRGQDEQP